MCICVTLAENGKDASGMKACAYEKVKRNNAAVPGMEEYRIYVCV